VANERAHVPMLLGAAGALGLAGLIGATAVPTLLSYSPLLLVALSPLPRHIVLAAPVTPMLPLVLVATARRLLACTLGYVLGRTFGQDGLRFLERRYPKASGLLRSLERLFERAAPAVLLVAPGPPFCALAGVTKMPLWLFLPVVTAAQVAWISLTYELGEALSAWVLPILAFFREHMLSTTLGFALIVLTYQLIRRRSRRSSALEELARAGSGLPGSETSAPAQPPSTGLS
jgi:membrane protein DedA with SNARE-associated domain